MCFIAHFVIIEVLTYLFVFTLRIIMAMRCDAMRCDAMRCDAMRCDAMRRDATDRSLYDMTRT